MDRDWGSRALAEFVGTFTLVFLGAGSIVVGERTLGEIAFAHGLAIAVMVSAVGHISGAHFNPAVTFGFLVTRKIVPALAAGYWFAQLAGASVAALLLRWLVPDAGELGTPLLADGVGAAEGVVIEALLTFLLVWVIFATAADPRGTFKSIAGLAIGLTITADILMGGPLTGAAMNPARAFGPELLSGTWDDFWVYWLGPLLGGAAAALAYEFLYLRPVGPEPVGPPETGVVEPRPGETAVS